MTQRTILKMGDPRLLQPSQPVETFDTPELHALVQDLLEFLLPEEADSDRFNSFYIDVFLDGLPPADWTYEWQAYISSGNATEVSLALDRLIQAVMFSPEYQTC